MFRRAHAALRRSTCLHGFWENLAAKSAPPSLAGVSCALALTLSCAGVISSVPEEEALEPKPAAPSVASPGAELASETSALVQRIARASVDGDPLRGGRLYDNFYSENPETEFTPDDPVTPETADGTGGPFGNGTLPDGMGARMDNTLEHGYRLKNFFGWDLRGAEGVYGPQYQAKSYVVSHNLIEDPLSREQVVQLLAAGAPGVPAYAEVMPEEDLGDVVAFVMAVREHELPQPGEIWELDPDAPKGYVLRSGASAVAGRRAIGTTCGGCHGSDGTRLLFDDGEFSLGSLARSSAYEVWFKIVVGNPGTPMGSQVPSDQPGPAQAQMVLDVLAALCDRREFPLGDASESDVVANDARCGEYLR